ncbi:autophagy-related protein 18 [Venturia nashicola]|nr:autophagy-related protein 18 [Venturia nashicola]
MSIIRSFFRRGPDLILGPGAVFGGVMNYITFNQDFSQVGVAARSGFRVYNTEPFSKKYQNNEGDVGMLEMLFSTTLVALVLSPRFLRIMNTQRGTTICDLTFPSKINAMRMNRKRMIVVLEGAVYIYDIGNMKLLHQIDTPPNPHALCALSPSSENNILAYPCPLVVSPSNTKKPSHVPPGSQASHAAPQNAGHVRIFDATTLESVNTIEAHQSAIGCLALNSDGTLLATASEKGTIIRVFAIPSGENLFQFRRGTLPAHIYNMSFNATSTLLSVSSASDTVHIFKLVNAAQRGSSPTSPTSERPPHSRSVEASSFGNASSSPSQNDDDDLALSRASSASPSAGLPSLQRKPSTFAEGLASRFRQVSQGMVSNVSSRMGSYLPTSITTALEPQRDFAHVKIPKTSLNNSNTGPMRSIVAMSPNHPQLMVVTSEGLMGVYNIDLERGGEGILERQESVFEGLGRRGVGIEE